MKKPETYEKLLELVNPKDLLEILNFSGINDKTGTTHWDLKRKYSKSIYNSINVKSKYSDIILDYWVNPQLYMKLNDDFYETLIKCIQDFYWWSHELHHIYAHVYKRVINALEIPIDKIKEIMKR